MNGNNRANPVAMSGEQVPAGADGQALQAVSQSFGVHVEAIWSDIHKDRLGADSMNATCGGKERVGRGYDRVAGTDLQRHENGDFGIGA
jgi:hypothetical protein